MVALSRRRFLGAAGGLAGALVAGCGAEEAAEAPPSDADVLAGLLRHEQALVTAPAGDTAAARAVRDQDRRHVGRLTRALSERGGAAGAPPAGDPASVPARKQQAVFVHVEALPRLSDPELRVLVMQIAASEAAHLAALRLAAGEEPVPDAFAGFTEAGAA